jgi:flagellar hook protein FlgE
MFLWDAGSGPTGGIEGFALEQSTTDIATELTQLIQTQRAYSSNAKIIQTVDEMLQETTNLKR